MASEKAAEKAKGGTSVRSLAIKGMIGLVLAGAGVAGGAFAMTQGLFGGKHAASTPGKSESVSPLTTEPVAYVTLEQGFTSNLKQSDSFVQVSLAVSTRGGEKVTEAIKKNEPALRSVVLQMLAEQDYASVSTGPGKAALLQRLRVALDHELAGKVGFGGIDNVYFTAFVLQ